MFFLIIVSCSNTNDNSKTTNNQITTSENPVVSPGFDGYVDIKNVKNIRMQGDTYTMTRTLFYLYDYDEVKKIVKMINSNKEKINSSEIEINAINSEPGLVGISIVT